jgi:uncharacterized lipoprotein YehR (DUF1307 family)
MWNSDTQYFIERWNEISEDKKRQEFIQSQVKSLLASEEFVMFFKKGGAIYGCDEDARLTFAKLKVPDEDSKGKWSKEANFLAINLTKGLKGDKVNNLFSVKDIKKIEILDKEEAEKKLIAQSNGKISKDKIQAKDTEPGTIQLKDKNEV